MSKSDYIHSHPTLGCSLRGISSNNTIQFRKLKYASIPSRYKDSFPNNVLQTDHNNTYDATTPGPSCPQHRSARAFDLSLIGDFTLHYDNKSDRAAAEVMHEFECLHLTVTCPELALGTSSKDKSSLPVFVWIHGGGLSFGSSTWPQYNLRAFVERSIAIGKPIIGVAINYRVGPFGFLASDEMDAEGNLGFKDQVLAFRWIKKHIAGFGGDPENVTAAGNSAGGISVSMLLCTDVHWNGMEDGEKGLFDRALIMSGDATLRRPRSQSWHENFYQDQAALLNVPLEDLKKTLIDTDAEVLAQRLPLAAHYSPLTPSPFLPSTPTLSRLSSGTDNMHQPSWCKEYVIGDTLHDGTIFKARILDQPNTLRKLKAACAEDLTPVETMRLLATYRLDDTLTSGSNDEKSWLLTLVSEFRFYLPSLCAHAGWLNSSSQDSPGRYHFHIPNPFPGAWTGLSSHELDVAFLLQNYNDCLSEANRELARGMADWVVGYVNGEGWCERGNVVVFEKEGVRETGVEEYDGVYRDGRGAMSSDIGTEKLWRVVERWQGVPNDE